MNPSPIEWCDTTWNPTTGCTKISPGCKFCYAKRIWKRVYQDREFEQLRMHDDRLYQPLQMRKGKRIFVNSMSDLFHEDIDDIFIDRVFAVMALCPQHTFQVLTKRADRMLEYVSEGGRAARVFDFMRNDEIGYWAGADKLPPQSWPIKNVWLGVSVEDQEYADLRIPLLLQTPAAVRFLSAEPLIGPIDLRSIKKPATLPTGPCGRSLTRVDWVITGGESGPGARPSHPAWFRTLRDQCAASGVPFFFKQWGEYLGGAMGDRHLHDFAFRREPDHVWEDDGDFAAFRVGKKVAGNTLDGRRHLEFPNA